MAERPRRVARKFAAIMAQIGMLVVMLRALRSGDSLDSAVTSALAWMILLGAVGGIVGVIAESTISESVRQRLQRELQAHPEKETRQDAVVAQRAS